MSLFCPFFGHYFRSGRRPQVLGFGVWGLGHPIFHPTAGSKEIWEQRPPNHHNPNEKGLGLTPPLPAGFGGIKTQQIQLLDGFLTFRGAEGFGNEVFGVVFTA